MTIADQSDTIRSHPFNAPDAAWFVNDKTWCHLGKYADTAKRWGKRVPSRQGYFKVKIWDYNTDDVDELSAHLAEVGSDSEVIQLSAGKLDFRTCVIELLGVSIRWNRFEQSLLFRQVIKEDRLKFGFLLEGSPPLRHSGNHIPAGQGIVQAPFSEHEYVNGRDTESLIVGVSVDLVKKLGWRTLPDVTHGVRAAIRNNLVHQCRKITAAARCTTPISRLAELELRDGLLDRLLPALEPWLATEREDAPQGETKNRSYHVYRQAVKAVSENNWSRPTIPLLSEHLKISERTLYRSFEDWVGMGPYKFFTLCRLHTFRRRILTGEPHRGIISRAARGTGFDELSRLAQIYKLHFGELPSETVAKRHELPGSIAG